MAPMTKLTVADLYARSDLRLAVGTCFGATKPATGKLPSPSYYTARAAHAIAGYSAPPAHPASAVAVIAFGGLFHDRE